MRFGIASNVLIVLTMAMLAGCAASTKKSPDAYETIGKDPRRDADLARIENSRAVALLDKGDYDGAETALKAALVADIMCGPAHNNLGKVYFHEKKLYMAAWEFQYAMKLMPNQPEPLNNLGLVFEATGKLDEATDSYTKAVTLEPDNVQAMGNLARAHVRRGDRDDAVKALLQKLVLRETRPDWLTWERTTLSQLQARPAEP
ncbi:MAG TPA: tetratricopeptide repeat protein [Humisphaera sp.]|nr:tetratricopeptide repeat protein [Humisphaera sp.]